MAGIWNSSDHSARTDHNGGDRLGRLDAPRGMTSADSMDAIPAGKLRGRPSFSMRDAPCNSPSASPTTSPGVHDRLPPGVPTADNEEGWHEALAKPRAYRGE